MLSSGSVLPVDTRRILHRIVTDLIQLHEGLVEELRFALENSQQHTPEYPMRSQRHMRWRSLDAVREATAANMPRAVIRSSIEKVHMATGTASQAMRSVELAGEVARIFDRKVSSRSRTMLP